MKQKLHNMYHRDYVGWFKNTLRNTMSKTALAATLAMVVFTANAEAKQIVLNCEIEGGYQTTQIMIDDDKGIVIYHFQYHNSSDSLRKFQSKDGKEIIVDMSMKITLNNDNFIMANNDSGLFLITKHDGRFVHPFVLPLPQTSSSGYSAFDNTHRGKCSKGPFD